MDPKTPTINKSTSVSIGLVIAVLAALAWGGSKIDTRLEGIENQLTEQKYAIKDLQKQVASADNARWTSAAMRIWTERLLSANPTIKLPRIDDLIR